MSSSVGKVLPVVCAALMGVPVWTVPSFAGDAPSTAALVAAEPAGGETPAAEPGGAETPAAEPGAAQTPAEPGAGEPAAAEQPPAPGNAGAAQAADQTSVEPDPAESDPAAPSPAESSPVEPNPAEPNPAESSPAEPNPAEPVPDDVDRPDLTVVVSGPDTGWAGGEGAYTMTVRNAPAATAAASGFTVSYVPAAGQTVQSVVSPADSDWACALSTEVSCTWFGALAPGAQTAPVTVVVGHGRRAAGTLTGRARVSAADDEVHLADNSRTLSTTMEQPELVVAVAAPESVAPGAPVRVVLAVTNTGPGWASDFSLVGALPDGMQLGSIGGDGFDCDAAARRCDYTDVLAPGLSASVAVDGVLAASYAGGPLTTSARLGQGGTAASAVTAVSALPPVPPVTPVTPPARTPVTAPVERAVAAPVLQPARRTAAAPQRPAAPATPPRRGATTSSAGTTTAVATAERAPVAGAPVAGAPETLPFTGSRGDDGLAAGVALVFSGLLLALAGRRRRTS